MMTLGLHRRGGAGATPGCSTAGRPPPITAAFGWVSRQGPKVLWDSVSRWVDAGKYVTSAGVSAGTDLGFYLVSRLAGRAVAEAAVLAAEYDWHRDPQEPLTFPTPPNMS